MLKVTIILTIVAIATGELLVLPLKRHINVTSKFGHRNAHLPMDDHRSYYTAELSIGTPEQKFNMILDTGSPYLWVASDICTSDFCSTPNRHLFNAGVSKTFATSSRKFRRMGYGTGLITEGLWATETMKIGKVKIEDQLFALALNPIKFPGDEDGIIGLGIAYGETRLNPLFKVFEKLKLKHVISFHLSKQPSLIFGIDKSKYRGEIAYAPVTHEISWIVRGDYVIIGNNSYDIQAASDTGTTSIVIPPKLIDEARNVHEIVFSFGGKEFTMPTFDYHLCHGSCIQGSLDDVWILGDSFLKKYYSIYDYTNKRVGFAEAV